MRSIVKDAGKNSQFFVRLQTVPGSSRYVLPLQGPDQTKYGVLLPYLI